MALEDDLRYELPGVRRRLHVLNIAQNAGQDVPNVDITLSDDEERDEEEERDISDCEAQIIVELDDDNDDPYDSSSEPWRNRNPPIPKELQLSSIRHKGTIIKPKTLVEVHRGPEEDYNWQFLYVSVIYINWARCIFLRGTRLTRQRNLRGMLPRSLNEICAFYDLVEEDVRPDDIQATVDIPISDVIRTRAFCRTNDAFPSHRFDSSQWDTTAKIEEEGILVQRWKYHRIWPTYKAMTSKNIKCYSGRVVRLRSTDIEDAFYRVPDEKLRNEFRGGVVRGGCYLNGPCALPVIDLATNNQRAAATLRPGQRYTVDDMFCGAGGASCGIRQAGLQVYVACDNDASACATFRHNFPEAHLMQKDIFDSYQRLSRLRSHSDCLHISPPCQFWSPAHTAPGRNDEANTAALFICGAMLKQRRPRLSTGEQTFGMLHKHHEQYFFALVGQYTSLGYSFSWDILRFVKYGVPSTRRRLGKSLRQAFSQSCGTYMNCLN